MQEVRLFVYGVDKIFVERHHSAVFECSERVDGALIDGGDDAYLCLLTARLFVHDGIAYEVLPGHYAVVFLLDIGSQGKHLLADEFGYLLRAKGYKQSVAANEDKIRQVAVLGATDDAEGDEVFITDY